MGNFLIKKVTLPLSAPVPGGPDRAEVLRAEEKGSDVNLASYLLLDAFDADFQKAVVVTNDLSQVASASPRLHDSELAASQFPAEMRDAKGPFHKPPQW